MRNAIIAGIMLSAFATSMPLFAQTNTDEVAQLKLRVAELEKQVKEISEFLEPIRGQQNIVPNRREALNKRVSRMFEEDRKKYTQEQVIEAENLYRVISQKGGTQEAKDSFDAMMTKFPEINRTGCAMLYMAQRAKGEERAKLLQECIEKHSDCMYGDGVQVGAFARFLMARDCSSKGDDKKAEALNAELKLNYADSIDHAGNLLVEQQAKLAKK